MKPRLFAFASTAAIVLLGLEAIQAAERTLGYHIVYATYLGGSQWDQAREIIVRPDGSVLVGMQTCSTGLPTTPGAVQPQYAGDDPALGHGGVYGGDCYLARLSADGRRILAATYFGGSKQERNVYGLALDRVGNVVFTSATRSPDAPTTPGCFQRKFGGGPSDMLVAKLNADLTRLLWCTYATYLGGNGDDLIRSLALGPEGEVYLVGSTSSDDFPVTDGAVQKQHGSKGDAFVVKLMPVMGQRP